MTTNLTPSRRLATARTLDRIAELTQMHAKKSPAARKAHEARGGDEALDRMRDAARRLRGDTLWSQSLGRYVTIPPPDGEGA